MATWHHETAERWFEKERNGTNMKQKGHSMECGSYRRIRLMEHTTKVLRLVDERLRDIVYIDEMQFGFMKGKGTRYFIWIVRQIQTVRTKRQ